MELEKQLLSLIFSFSYGILVSYIVNILYYYLNNTKLKYKMLLNLLIFVNVFLLYFICLRKINNGIIHVYFIIVLIIGFSLFNKNNYKLRKFLNFNVKKSKIKDE